MQERIPINTLFLLLYALGGTPNQHKIGRGWYDLI
jgi:hypothetical protein